MQSAVARTLLSRAAAPAARAVFAPAARAPTARAVSFAAVRPATVQFASPMVCRAMSGSGFLDAKEVRREDNYSSSQRAHNVSRLRSYFATKYTCFYSCTWEYLCLLYAVFLCITLSLSTHGGAVCKMAYCVLHG